MKFELEPYHRNLTKDELLLDLKRVASQIGRNNLTQKEYLEEGKYAIGTFINHFGSWRKALSEAGISRARNWGTTLEEYFENIEEVWVKLGRQPKYEEMQIPFSKLSGTAYLHKFGRWRTALEQFVEYINKEGKEIPDKVTDKSKNRVITKHATIKREINWRLRFIVMRRDNFKCKICGRSPATDLKIILHVDHIVPWSKGGETVPENLQTLCSKCNIGKSNLHN